MKGSGVGNCRRGRVAAVAEAMACVRSCMACMAFSSSARCASRQRLGRETRSAAKSAAERSGSPLSASIYWAPARPWPRWPGPGNAAASVSQSRSQAPLIWLPPPSSLPLSPRLLRLLRSRVPAPGPGGGRRPGDTRPLAGRASLQATTETKTQTLPAQSENPSGMGVSTLIFPSAQPNTCMQISVSRKLLCCTTATWCFCSKLTAQQIERQYRNTHFLVMPMQACALTARGRKHPPESDCENGSSSHVTRTESTNWRGSRRA